MVFWPSARHKRIEFLRNMSGNMDIHVFQQLPIYIRKRILKDCKVIFCKDDKLLYEIAFSTIKEFEFYEKLYKMYLKSVKNG